MEKKRLVFFIAVILLLSVSLTKAESSMTMVQLGLSGTITTPSIITEDMGAGTEKILLGTSTGFTSSPRTANWKDTCKQPLPLPT